MLLGILCVACAGYAALKTFTVREWAKGFNEGQKCRQCGKQNHLGYWAFHN